MNADEGRAALVLTGGGARAAYQVGVLVAIRELRGKRMTASSLDGIAGLGDARKKKLTQVMGGVNAVKKASLDELKALSFLPDAVAEAVHAKFHGG